MEPTKEDLKDPMFNAIWGAIKGWEIERKPEDGIAAATGTDVMAILSEVRKVASLKKGEEDKAG